MRHVVIDDDVRRVGVVQALAVVAQRAALAEGGAAHRAGVGFGVRVGQNVTVELMFLSEPFPAMNAHVWPLPRVF